MKVISKLVHVSTFALSSILLGCGTTQTSERAIVDGASVTGKVFGGQQPVFGASVVLYAAGASGNGIGATNLLKSAVTTSANGGFNITNDYTCPTSATQVYLIARGGNPGLATPTNNAAATVMAALGDCGNLNSGTYITINEATTAAAVWALAQFIGPGGNVGASSTNATGLRNAFGTASNLANVATGTSPGANFPTGASMETAKLYTLADALAVCLNSDGGATCNPLFAASTNAGVVPANTLDAALAIVRNPALHCSDVLNASGAQGPFQPTLASVPNDWTMTVKYSGGGLNLPTALSVDGFGNVWVANYFGGAVSEFSPTGHAFAANGFAGGLYESYGLTIDASNNVWVTNQETNYAVNAADGSLTEFNQAGQVVSGNGFAAGGVYFPVAAAADSNGSVWVANNGHSSATLFGAGGAAISGSSGFGGALLPFPLAVALDANHNAWFAVQGGASRIAPDGTTASFACCDRPAGIAVDQGGNIWLGDYYSSRIVELSSAGAVLQSPTAVGGVTNPQSIAIDGAGTVWITNFRGNTVSALAGYAAANPGSAISPGSGFGLAGGMLEPFGLGLDASGNLWIANAGNNSVTEIIGLASPIRTPLLGPPQQP